MVAELNTIKTHAGGWKLRHGRRRFFFPFLLLLSLEQTGQRKSEAAVEARVTATR